MKIKNFILKNNKIFDSDFLKRFPSEKDILEAEKILNYKLPEEYVVDTINN